MECAGAVGLAYWCGVLPGDGSCPYKNKADSLFVADGACNAVVEITMPAVSWRTMRSPSSPAARSSSASIPKTSCATLVKAGSPLDKPVAMAILPNGNLIVANTGNNTLVEMTPTGQVLDTKVVDKSKTSGIFGLAAIGKTTAIPRSSTPTRIPTRYTNSNSSTYFIRHGDLEHDAKN